MYLFIVEHVGHFKKGRFIFLRFNIINKYWVEICGSAHPLAAMTNKPKIHGVMTEGGAIPTGGRGGRRRGGKGYSYMRKRDVGTDLHGDTVVLGF